MSDFKPGDRVRLTDAYSRKNPDDFPGVVLEGRTGTVVHFDDYYDVVLDNPINGDPDDPDYLIGTENYTALFTEDEIGKING
jgi:hypothetical protein